MSPDHPTRGAACETFPHLSTFPEPDSYSLQSRNPSRTVQVSYDNHQHLFKFSQSLRRHFIGIVVRHKLNSEPQRLFLGGFSRILSLFQPLLSAITTTPMSLYTCLGTCLYLLVLFLQNISSAKVVSTRLAAGTLEN